MERLSGLDASFLYVESPTVPLHVCSIVELDTSTIPGGYGFDRLSDALTSRMKSLPEFRAKLADSQLNLDHPVWVEDTDFDMSRHLNRIGLPSPWRGGHAVMTSRRSCRICWLCCRCAWALSSV